MRKGTFFPVAHDDNHYFYSMDDICSLAMQRTLAHVQRNAVLFPSEGGLMMKDPVSFLG